MSYSDRLNARFKAKRAVREGRRRARKRGADTPPAAEPPPEAGFVHPRRYPVHADAAKGQVYGGECNTTACENHGSVWFNRGTFGLYCTTCARGHNWRWQDPAVSVLVDEKPACEEMERHHAEMMAEMAAQRTGTEEGDRHE